MTMGAPIMSPADMEEMPDWVRPLVEQAPPVSTEQANRINAAFMEFRRSRDDASPQRIGEAA
jgi:hypothetical protein